MGFFSLFKNKKEDLTKDLTAEREGKDLNELFESYDDQFLSDLGVDDIQEIIRDMLRDSQVSSEYATFKSYVSKSNYAIQPADENETKLSEAYQEYLDRDGDRLLTLTETFYQALEYGSVIIEVIWEDFENTNGTYVIKELKPLDPCRYGFNKKGEMVDKDTKEVLDEDTPYKYLSISHDVREGNLEGNSLILKAYWPWIFRKACITAGVLYVKKSIIPSIIAIYKAAKGKEEIKDQGAFIAQELSTLANSAGVALTNVEDLKVVDPTSKGTDIVDLIAVFDQMISKAFLGVATLTNDTRYGSKGENQAQEDLIEYRARKVAVQEFQPAINILLRWTAELNLGVVDPSKLPSFKYIYEYDPNFEEVMEAIRNRVPISGAWFYKKYNIKPPDENVEDDILVPAVADTVSDVQASSDAFFLNSERPTNKPKLMKKISRSLLNITAR